MPVLGRALRGSARRVLVGGMLALSVTIAACHGCGGGGGGSSSPPATADESRVARENQKPGTDEWQFWRYGFTRADDTAEQVKGYASATSVDHGGAITFFISVDPPQPYTIDVYRVGWYGGLGGALAASVGPFDGVRQPECPLDAKTGLIACDWQQSYVLQVPASWTTGVYLAVVRNQQKFAGFIVFVVRDDERAPAIVYQQSVTTYQAYNSYPADGRRGKSLYGDSFGAPTIAGNTRAIEVSFDRPYAGDGAGQFLAWEVDFVRWLERSGYDVGYTTDIDTHVNGAAMLGARAFLSVGHDEYWSREMVDAVEQARDHGVNLGFFGGNEVYWQIRFAPSASGVPNRIMVCYKDAALDPVQGATTTVRWGLPPAGRPPQPLVGLGFGDIIADGIHGSYADYVVQHADHWVYAGSSLHDGDAVRGIVGYEADFYDPPTPLPVQRDASWTLLSTSPYRDFAGQPSHANSAVYQAPSGAWVFAAGSIGWSLGLDDFSDRAVPDERLQRVTRNVLDRFVR